MTPSNGMNVSSHVLVEDIVGSYPVPKMLDHFADLIDQKSHQLYEIHNG